MAKAGFFKRSSTKEEVKEQTVSNETIRNIVKREDENYEIKQIKDTTIMDRDITKYVIDNFPEICMDIKDSLADLSETLENTIDYIEDKSSVVIKTERNFKLSQSHRNKSIEIYEVVKKINDYIEWMDGEYNKKDGEPSKKKAKDEVNKNKNITKETESDSKGREGAIPIYEDFTSKEPLAFRLENYYLKVNDWEELAVKAAEVLTKNYKGAKKRFSNRNKDIKVINKNSKENELRDSVIDILNIYEVPLDMFFVYVK